MLFACYTGSACLCSWTSYLADRKSVLFSRTGRGGDTNQRTYLSPAVGKADAEIKLHLLRTKSSKVLPVKPGVGQNIAMHVEPTARDFFLSCGVVWCGVVYCVVLSCCGVVWCGLTCCGVAWRVVLCCAVLCFVVVWCIMLCSVVVWCIVLCCVVVWCGVF